MSKFNQVCEFEQLIDERHDRLLGTSPYIKGEIHGRKYIVAWIHEHHYVAYVNVPKGSDIHGIDYMWLYYDSPDVHGGVTWTGSIDICDDDYYIGWDYAHSRDEDRHITEDEIMRHVNNCAEWVNKPKHKVVCDHCNQEVTA